MTVEFNKVEANDFLTFSRETPAHVKIESMLIEIGGGSKKGIEFKQTVMAKAGWKYKELTSYGAYSQTAADAFNRIAKVLQTTQDKIEILSKL